MRRLLFKTCPKSGRIIGLDHRQPLVRLVVPLLTFASVGWFLLRVLPRPARAAYPCQQAIGPAALQALTSAATATGLAALWRRCRPRRGAPRKPAGGSSG